MTYEHEVEMDPIYFSTDFQFLLFVNIAGLFISSMATLAPANKGYKFLCGIIYNYIDCANFCSK